MLSDLGSMQSTQAHGDGAGDDSYYDYSGPLEEDEALWHEVDDYATVRARMVSTGGGTNSRDMYSACRVGDLERVKFLVEVEEVNINAKDKWDALPIYFACLCGHEDVLDYLLTMSARLDLGTCE